MKIQIQRAEFLNKLDIKIPIIRINTAFEDYSSIKKVTILPRIYHDWMSFDMAKKSEGDYTKNCVSPFSHIIGNSDFCWNNEWK